MTVEEYLEQRKVLDRVAIDNVFTCNKCGRSETFQNVFDGGICSTCDWARTMNKNRDSRMFTGKDADSYKDTSFRQHEVAISGGGERNIAKCAKCGDIIESMHVHDFVYCSCKAIFVDGGREYIRRGGNEEDFIEVDDNEV